MLPQPRGVQTRVAPEIGNIYRLQNSTVCPSQHESPPAAHRSASTSVRVRMPRATSPRASTLSYFLTLADNPYFKEYTWATIKQALRLHRLEGLPYGRGASAGAFAATGLSHWVFYKKNRRAEVKRVGNSTGRQHGSMPWKGSYSRLQKPKKRLQWIDTSQLRQGTHG